MPTVNSLFKSAKKSYKEHRARRNLNKAVQAALGSKMANLNNFFGNTTNSSLEEQYIVNSLTLLLDPNNSYQRYPVLSTDSAVSQTKNTVKPKTLTTKSKGKLRKLDSSQLLFFPTEDALSHRPARSSPTTVSLSLSERRAKHKASQVYYKNTPDDVIKLGCTFRTLKLVVAMDNYFSLSKLPTSHSLRLLMKNQDFVDTYHDAMQSDLADSLEGSTRVSFDETVHTKIFDTSELPAPIAPHISDLVTKPILKNHINNNYLQESELSQCCDKIDSGMFIRLLDMAMKKRVKHYCVSKLLQNYSI